MRKIFSCLIILLFINTLSAIVGVGLGFMGNLNDDDHAFVNIYSSLNNKTYAYHSLGLGFVYSFFDRGDFTAEYYYKTSMEGMGCSYITIKSGITTESEFLAGLDYTINPLGYVLKLNLLQVRMTADSKPVVGAGISLGMGLQWNMYQLLEALLE